TAVYPLSIGWLMCTSLGGQVYCGGGINAAESLKTYRYDLGTNTWDDASIADLPVTRWGSPNATYKGQWLIAGGYSVGVIVATALKWDSVSNTWSPIDSMLVARARTSGATVINGVLPFPGFYAIGGREPGGAFGGNTDNQR